MEIKEFMPVQNRRDFVRKAFSSCAICCLAVPKVFTSGIESISMDPDDKHKFLKDSGMSLQAVYDFAFKSWYIPAMKCLMDQIGKERFLELLKESSESIQSSNEYQDANYPERSLSVWISYIKQSCKHMNDRLSYEIIKESDKEFEVKFTECLWAKTFREAGVPEIGYAGVCYQDYAMTKKFSSQLELVREKTLMEGYECCHFRWSWEG